MQKVVAFYHDKDIDALKLGCTLLKLANKCLPKSAAAKFCPITERKIFWRKFEKMLLMVHLPFLHVKAVVGETLFGNSTNNCQSIDAIDASQLYSYSMCQPMPTGLHLRFDPHSEANRFTSVKTRPICSKILSCPFFSKKVQIVKSHASVSKQKKNECFGVDVICSHCNTVFEALSCFL